MEGAGWRGRNVTARIRIESLVVDALFEKHSLEPQGEKSVGVEIASVNVETEQSTHKAGDACDSQDPKYQEWVIFALVKVSAHVNDSGEALLLSSNAFKSFSMIVPATSAVAQLKLAFAENVLKSELTVMIWIDTGCRVIVSTASADKNAFQAEHPPAIKRLSTVTSE